MRFMTPDKLPTKLSLSNYWVIIKVILRPINSLDE